jgi:hypothetical protein
MNRRHRLSALLLLAGFGISLSTSAQWFSPWGSENDLATAWGLEPSSLEDPDEGPGETIDYNSTEQPFGMNLQSGNELQPPRAAPRPPAVRPAAPPAPLAKTKPTPPPQARTAPPSAPRGYYQRTAPPPRSYGYRQPPRPMPYYAPKPLPPIRMPAPMSPYPPYYRR